MQMRSRRKNRQQERAADYTRKPWQFFASLTDDEVLELSDKLGITYHGRMITASMIYRHFKRMRNNG